MSRVSEFRAVGLGYVIEYPDITTSFHVDRLKVSGGAMQGDVMVKTSLPDARTYAGGLLHYSRETLSSQSARRSLGKTLDEKVPSEKSLDWFGMYDEFCTSVMLADRVGQPAEMVGNLPARTQERLLLDPLLPMGNGSILFGDGGLGKSIMALAIAISVQTGKTIIPGFRPTSTGPVLILNWETTKEDIDDRLKAICAGANIETPDMVHMHGRGRPLAHQVESIARRADETGAVLVVVDSANKAIGTSGEGPIEDAVNRFTSSLDEIGRSSLCIDHVSKYTAEGNGAGKPIGSTTKSNWARATWELRRSSKEASTSHLTVYNRKVNDADQAEPIGLAMKWDGRSVTWSEDDPQYETYGNQAGPPMATRISDILGDHPFRAREIATMLGTTESNIRTVLNRHKDRFTKLDTGDWANLHGA